MNIEEQIVESQNAHQKLVERCRFLQTDNNILLSILYQAQNVDLYKTYLIKSDELYLKAGIPNVMSHLDTLLERELFELVKPSYEHLLQTENDHEFSEEVLLPRIENVLCRVFGLLPVQSIEIEDVVFQTFEYMIHASSSIYRNCITFFLRMNHEYIGNQVAETNSSQIILQYVRCLLSYNLNLEVRSFFGQLIETWSFLDANVGREEFYQFLWFSFYLDMDTEFLNSVESSRIYFTGKYPEMQLYKLYYDLEYKRTLDGTPMNTLLDQVQWYNETEKQQVFAKVYEKITHLKTVEQPSEKRLPVASKLLQIRKNTLSCKHCSGQSLQSESFLLEIYNRKSGDVY